jgi:hypothetical protein
VEATAADVFHWRVAAKLFGILVARRARYDTITSEPEREDTT